MLKRLWIGFALAFILGMTVEFNRGNPPKTKEPVVVQDDSGRRLLLLIIDSLSIPNFKAMPALREHAENGFYAEVEPCLERITYVCVKETLTGRTAFTLFGLFQNFGVGATDPGANLLRDARAAGMSVAMVSAGDLKPFKVDVDIDKRFKKGPSQREEKKAEALAQDADVLVYHWIWHDTVAHHARVGTKKYKASVRRSNTLVRDVLEWLPEDMDLIVAGDHGHTNDGRHVQGLDIPTVVVANSPNIEPVHLKERIPISALRTLSGAVIGVLSDQVDWDPSWVSWLGAPLGTQARALISSGSARPPPSMPLGAIGVCGILVWLASAVGRRWWAVGLAAAAIGMGLSFEAWMAWIHFPDGLPRIHEVLWRVPLAAGVIGLIIVRSPKGALTAMTLSVGATALILYPVPHHYGALKNLSNLVSPLLLGLGLAALTKPGWARRIAIFGLALASAWLMLKLVDFRVFNLEITKFKIAKMVHKNPTEAGLWVGCIAAAIHTMLEREGWLKRLGFAAVAGVGASGVLELPAATYVLPTVIIFVSFFWRRAGHARLFSLGLAWAAPFMYTMPQLVGLYSTVGLVLAGVWMAKVADQGSTSRWAAALVMLLGSYLGLAYTFKLTTSGIDFGFALEWLPGRLHEQFWWVIAIVMTFKCLAHVPLIVVGLQRIFGEEARTVAQNTAGLALLRYTFVAIFAISWLIGAGEQAGGMRLAAMLQDAFYWLIVGLMTVGMVRLGPRLPSTETEE